MKRKALILAGGEGTRLFPATKAVSKQLLPIYDKPMIYYPLSLVMKAGIQEILIISTPRDISSYENLLAGGEQWGIDISYAVQDKPRGIADAFRVGKDFIDNSDPVLILGDNIFYGASIKELLTRANDRTEGATVFACQVNDPERYGVIEFDKYDQPVSIVEKPKNPKSNFALTGLYFYDHMAVEFFKDLNPSKRGELEISDINNIYLSERKLNVEKMSAGYTWLDTGTHESLVQANQFVQTIQQRQGILVGSPEEEAFKNKWITSEDLLKISETLKKTSYGHKLMDLVGRNED